MIGIEVRLALPFIILSQPLQQVFPQKYEVRPSPILIVLNLLWWSYGRPRCVYRTRGANSLLGYFSGVRSRFHIVGITSGSNSFLVSLGHV